MTVGVIGLGNMGAELANNLVQAGFDVVTHDVAGPTRNPAGAAFVESPAAVAERAEAVVLSLPNGAISAEVAAALAAAPDRAVTVVIDTSTIGPDAARSIAAALAEAGVGYVDAPVSGGAAGARARTLTVMYSGTPDAAAAASAVIEGLSDRRFHVGDAAGLAQAVKLANNFLSATALAFVPSLRRGALAPWSLPEPAARGWSTGAAPGPECPARNERGVSRGLGLCSPHGQGEGCGADHQRPP